MKNTLSNLTAPRKKTTINKWVKAFKSPEANLL